MQQMLNTKDLTDDPTRTSAFHPVAHQTKSPLDHGQSRRGHDKKRDSGYGSDFSPAAVKSVARRFTYEIGDGDYDECVDNSEMDVTGKDGDMFDEDEDVFVEHFEYGFSAIQELEEEGDDTDKEVEELLHDSPALNHPVCDPIDISRPPAPIPTPGSIGVGGDRINVNTLNNSSQVECLIASPYYHTQWTKRDRVLKRNPFRPFVSRSIGTQTPNLHCQLIRDALGSDNIADPQRHVDRGHLTLRLRMPSDIESYSRRLPDVIPMTRDRSISLPDVESFRRREQEQLVGRELRRISDAFNTEYGCKSGRKGYTSTPLRGYWDSIRRIVSSSAIFQAWVQSQEDEP